MSIDLLKNLLVSGQWSALCCCSLIVELARADRATSNGNTFSCGVVMLSKWASPLSPIAVHFSISHRIYMAESAHICVTTASVCSDFAAVIAFVLDVTRSMSCAVKLCSESKLCKATTRAHHGLFHRLCIIVWTRLGVTAAVDIATKEGDMAL